MTSGADAQRSHWIPADTKINRETLNKPGFQVLWKVKLSNEAVQFNSLTPAVLMDRYIGYRGFRSLAFLGGSANTVFAIDTDLSRVEWQQRLHLPAPPAGSLGCPGGLTANVARETTVGYPPLEAVGGGLGGRGGPARSDVARPGEGAVTIRASIAAAAARGGGPRPPRQRRAAVVYVVAGDGMLHSLYISNGMEPEPALPFLPPNANAKGLIVLDRIAYAATATENCSGVSSGVWALDLDSKQISHWEPSAGAVVGSTGPAFGPDGTVYAATSSGQLAALSGGGLKLMASYATDGQPFTSSPVVFPYKGKTLVAAATQDGRIHLLDGMALGGPDHKTALFKTMPYSSKGFAPSALATWLDADGVRWVLAAAAAAAGSSPGFSQTNGSVTNGAITTWRVADYHGAITLEPGWLSRDMIAPLTPAVINGVVFAVSSGEFASGENLPVAERVRRSSPAILYALDGATGRKLWDSGRTITSFVHSGGVTGESGQVYLETYDETLYAFGFPTEH